MSARDEHASQILLDVPLSNPGENNEIERICSRPTSAVASRASHRRRCGAAAI